MASTLCLIRSWADELGSVWSALEFLELHGDSGSQDSAYHCGRHTRLEDTDGEDNSDVVVPSSIVVRVPTAKKRVAATAKLSAEGDEGVTMKSMMRLTNSQFEQVLQGPGEQMNLYESVRGDVSFLQQQREKAFLQLGTWLDRLGAIAGTGEGAKLMQSQIDAFAADVRHISGEVRRGQAFPRLDLLCPPRRRPAGSRSCGRWHWGCHGVKLDDLQHITGHTCSSA